MNLTVCSKLCSECPFSEASPKGWLGFHTLDGVLEAQKKKSYEVVIWQEKMK